MHNSVDWTAWLWAGRPKNVNSIPSSVQTAGFGTQPAYPMDSGESFPGAKWTVCETDYSPPLEPRLRTRVYIPPVSLTTSWCGACEDLTALHLPTVPTYYDKIEGRAIAQAVSRRLRTAAAWVRA
jgi:hypothetical protein